MPGIVGGGPGGIVGGVVGSPGGVGSAGTVGSVVGIGVPGSRVGIPGVPPPGVNVGGIGGVGVPGAGVLPGSVGSFLPVGVGSGSPGSGQGPRAVTVLGQLPHGVCSGAPGPWVQQYPIAANASGLGIPGALHPMLNTARSAHGSPPSEHVGSIAFGVHTSLHAQKVSL